MLLRIFVRKTFALITNRIEYKFFFFSLLFVWCNRHIGKQWELFNIACSRRSSLKFQTYRPIVSSSNNNWHYSCELSLLFEYDRTWTERSRARALSSCAVVARHSSSRSYLLHFFFIILHFTIRALSFIIATLRTSFFNNKVIHSSTSVTNFVVFPDRRVFFYLFCFLWSSSISSSNTYESLNYVSFSLFL